MLSSTLEDLAGTREEKRITTLHGTSNAGCQHHVEAATWVLDCPILSLRSVELALICHWLSWRGIVSLARCCQRFYQDLQHPYCWKGTSGSHNRATFASPARKTSPHLSSTHFKAASRSRLLCHLQAVVFDCSSLIMLRALPRFGELRELHLSSPWSSSAMAPTPPHVHLLEQAFVALAPSLKVLDYHMWLGWGKVLEHLLPLLQMLEELFLETDGITLDPDFSFLLQLPKLKWLGERNTWHGNVIPLAVVARLPTLEVFFQSVMVSKTVIELADLFTPENPTRLVSLVVRVSESLTESLWHSLSKFASLTELSLSFDNVGHWTSGRLSDFFDLALHCRLPLLKKLDLGGSIHLSTPHGQTEVLLKLVQWLSPNYLPSMHSLQLRIDYQMADELQPGMADHLCELANFTSNTEATFPQLSIDCVQLSSSAHESMVWLLPVHCFFPHASSLTIGPVDFFMPYPIYGLSWLVLLPLESLEFKWKLHHEQICQVAELQQYFSSRGWELEVRHNGGLILTEDDVTHARWFVDTGALLLPGNISSAQDSRGWD